MAADGSTRPTIFAEMSALALRTGAANLGQGFPDEDGPEWIRQLAADNILAGHNQYPPGRGIAELRAAIAESQEWHYGLSFNPETEVLVTAGATEALTAAILAYAGPDDEVVTLEPFYDSHAAAIAMAGARHVTVPLTAGPQGFAVDLAALDLAVTDRTRLIVLNTPHNPTGTVLTDAELTAIAEAAQRVDAVVVTDEVYEHLVFDGLKHRPIASLPGMRERTITISSAGKTFSLTGWKIGWATAPEHLIEGMLSIKQFLTYSGGAPFQPAIAHALRQGHADIIALRSSLSERRNLLLTGLQQAGFDVVTPAGTYFICADATPFLSPEIPDGAAFARVLPERIGVACVPVSAFCHEGSPVAESLKNWVRFTFVKDVPTLERGIAGLQKLSTLHP